MVVNFGVPPEFNSHEEAVPVYLKSGEEAGLPNLIRCD